MVIEFVHCNNIVKIMEIFVHRLGEIPIGPFWLGRCLSPADIPLNFCCTVNTFGHVKNMRQMKGEQKD